MANRYLDWYRQAEADLDHARHALKDGDYDWSCFASQQASEKAIKAVFQKRSMDAWGHTLTVLIGNLRSVVEVPDNLIQGARVLDKHYIPSRYPNGFDSGAPIDFYTKEESQNAVRIAEDILEFCRHQID